MDAATSKRDLVLSKARNALLVQPRESGLKTEQFDSKLLDALTRHGSFGQIMNPPPEAETELLFVLQRHCKPRVHHDLRLEMDGMMLSWALVDGPSLRPGLGQPAYEVPPHPMSCYEQEGGDYAIVDRGYYRCSALQKEIVRPPSPARDARIIDKSDQQDKARQQFGAGEMSLVFFGQGVMRGRWRLTRIGYHANSKSPWNWLLIKLQDQYSDSKFEQGSQLLRTSILSGRTNRQIREDHADYLDQLRGISPPRDADGIRLPREQWPRAAGPLTQPVAQLSVKSESRESKAALVAPVPLRLLANASPLLLTAGQHSCHTACTAHELQQGDAAAGLNASPNHGSPAGKRGARDAVKLELHEEDSTPLRSVSRKRSLTRAMAGEQVEASAAKRVKSGEDQPFQPPRRAPSSSNHSSSNSESNEKARSASASREVIDLT